MSLTDTTSIQEMTPEALAQARGVTASASWLPKAVSADHLEEPATAYEAAPVQPGRVALRLVSQQQLIEVPLEAVIDKLPALADGQGAMAAALDQPQDLGDSADMAHILDYARGALAKLREMKALTGDSELDELISRLAADLEQGNLAGLREMLDDIQKAIGDAAAKGRESDAPETPEQKAERLWQQVKEDIKEAKEDINTVGQAGVVGFEKEEEEKWKKRLQAIEDMPEETDAQKAAKLKALEQYYHDWGKQLETLRNDPANSPEQNPNAAAVLDDKIQTNDRRIETAQQTKQAIDSVIQSRQTVQEVAEPTHEVAPKALEQLNIQSANAGLGAISLGAAPVAVSATAPASALPAVQLSTPIQLTEADPASTGQLPAPTAPVQLAKAEVSGPSTSF